MRNGPSSLEDSPQQHSPSGSQKLSEDREQSLLADLETVLLMARKINEGDDGVIAHVDLNRLRPELRQAIFGSVEIPEGQAIKILKIYKPGAGKREFEAQKAAYEALEGHENCASIPKPYLYRDLKIFNPELQEKLATDCRSTKPVEHVEILVMDLVEGEDLATRLFREVLRRHPQASQYRGMAETAGIDPLIRETRSALYKSDEAFRNDKKNPFVFIKAVTDFLKADGYTIDRSISKKLQKAINILHEKGIFHRTLHWRNIMLDKNDQPYLVDFGAAYVSGRDTGAAYPDEESVAATGKDYLQDDHVIDLCEKLRPTGTENLSTDIDALYDKANVDHTSLGMLQTSLARFETLNVPITAEKIDAIMNSHLFSSTEKLKEEDTRVQFLLTIAAVDQENAADSVIEYINRTGDAELQKLLPALQEMAQKKKAA